MRSEVNNPPDWSSCIFLTVAMSCKAYSTKGTSLESYTSNRLYLGVACVADNMHITIYKPAIWLYARTEVHVNHGSVQCKKSSLLKSSLLALSIQNQQNVMSHLYCKGRCVVRYPHGQSLPF